MFQSSLSFILAFVKDYLESYIGLSATDIQVKRDQESVKYWGSASKFDVDYYEKAMNVAMKIKGY